MFGKDLREAVRLLDGLHHLAGSRECLVSRSTRIQDVLPQAELASHFLGDGNLVSRDHLHLYAHLAAVATVCSESSRGGSNSGRTQEISIARLHHCAPRLKSGNRARQNR